MEERVICKNCGASILKQTATRTGGVCKPCYNFNINSTIGETPFGRAFDSFNVPHRFNLNDDFRYELTSIWVYVSNNVITLLSSIRHGKYDEVFVDRKYPAGLKLRDAEHFREWCLTHLEQARRQANELEVETIERIVDRSTLLEKIDKVQTAVELAYEVLKNREISNGKAFN